MHTWALALGILGGSLLGTPAASGDPLAAETFRSGNAGLEAPLVLRPGDGMPVAVDGFTPGAEVQLFLMGPGPSARLLRPVPGDGTPVVDSLGRARWNVRIPPDVEQKLDANGRWWLSADDLNGRYANQPLSLFTGTAPFDTPIPGVSTASDTHNQSLGASSVSPETVVPSSPAAPAPALPTRRPLPREERWATVKAPALSLGLRSFVTSVPLRVRAEPSLDAAVIGGTPRGTWLRVLDEIAVETEEAHFYRVELANGTRGYVAPPPEDVATIISVREGQTLQGYRLRVEPSGQGTFLAMVPLGARVRVLEMGEDSMIRPDEELWAYVRVEVRGRTLEGYLPSAGLRMDSSGR